MQYKDIKSKIREYANERAGNFQTSTTDQLKELMEIGNLLGLYDAVDAMKELLKEPPQSHFDEISYDSWMRGEA